MSKAFQVGKAYKLSVGAATFLKLSCRAEFAGEDGVFKVASVTELDAFSDDVTSPVIEDQFSIPHFMYDDCEEVTDAS